MPRRRSIGFRHGENEGVLITKCKSIHTLFMRFPIDVAFIDSKGTVRRTIRKLSPWKLTGIIFGASMALELSEGMLEKTETVDGDEISGFEKVLNV